MKTAVHTEMHQEHLKWKSDLSMWRDDLEQWKSRIDLAVAEAKMVEESLRDHSQILLKHLEEINADERSIHDHESALSDFERGGQGAPLVGMAVAHKENAEKHAGLVAAHEHLKKRHHSIVARWNALRKALVLKNEKPRQAVQTPEAMG